MCFGLLKMCFGLLKTSKILLNVMSIYLFVDYFSKLLLLDFRCWLFSVLHILFLFCMFIFMGQITRSTFCSGRMKSSYIISNA